MKIKCAVFFMVVSMCCVCVIRDAQAATDKTLTGNLTVSSKLEVQGALIGVTPTAATHFTTKAYVDEASEFPVFKGYTGTTTGGLGGIDGINNTCNSSYSGSHACTFEEIIRLGASYTYTYNVWVVDGSYFSSFGQEVVEGYQITKDGAANTAGATPNAPMCDGWNNATASYYGPYLSTAGSMGVQSCATATRIACCD